MNPTMKQQRVRALQHKQRKKGSGKKHIQVHSVAAMRNDPVVFISDFQGANQEIFGQHGWIPHVSVHLLNDSGRPERQPGLRQAGSLCRVSSCCEK